MRVCEKCADKAVKSKYINKIKYKKGGGNEREYLLETKAKTKMKTKKPMIREGKKK